MSGREERRGRGGCRKGGSDVDISGVSIATGCPAAWVPGCLARQAAAGAW